MVEAACSRLKVERWYNLAPQPSFQTAGDAEHYLRDLESPERY